MKLKKLYLKNIRSYKEEEIVFPEGSVLLAGDVGAGKSTILLALEYSFFGLQPGQRGALLLRNNSEYGIVILEFEVNGKNIVIERRLKRGNKSVTNEYASIIIDKEKVEASLTEIKTIILEYLGYPRELIKKNNLLYRYTVYTPQEQMKQIILEDRETRLNILRHILGIEKYRRIRENLTILLTQIKEESKVLQGEIKTLEEEKSKLEIKKLSLKGLEKELGEKAIKLEAKSALVKQLESEKKQLDDKIKECDYLMREVEKTNIMITNKNENKENIMRELKETNKIISETKEIFNEKEYIDILKLIDAKNEEIENFNVSYMNLLGEINSLEKIQKENMIKRERMFKIEICPTCLQDVPECHKHNILNETEGVISKAKQKTALLEEQIIFLTKSIGKAKAEKKELENKKTYREILKMRLEYLENTKKKCKILNEQLNVIEQDISLLNKHQINLKDKILEFSRFENMIRVKNEEIRYALQEERKAEVSLAEVKKELDMTKREISEREESIAVKEASKKNLAHRLELHDWLSINFLELIEFIERNVLIKIRQEFSTIFSKWFHMLVSQDSLNVKLDESFSPILLQNDIEMEYSFLSGGERTAVALAYRLALNQTINSLLSKIKTKDIVVLDEPTEGFSEMQLDRMREVLQELKVAQLIIVSHEQKVESFVESVIRVVKTGNVSHLEKGDLKAMGEIGEDIKEKIMIDSFKEEIPYEEEILTNFQKED